jgi:hypothetical protein
VLGQTVGDLEPWRLAVDEDVRPPRPLGRRNGSSRLGSAGKVPTRERDLAFMLRERVEDFIAKRRDPAELHMLLNECVADGTVEGLACVRRLYESSYGGTMFNFELKHPAASTLVFWGEAGIQALVDGASADPTTENSSFCIQLLSSIAAGSALPPFAFLRDAELAAKIEATRAAKPELPGFCRVLLIDFILSFESDDDVAFRIGSGISGLTFSEVPAAKELFAALSARWLAVSKPVFDRGRGGKGIRTVGRS